MLDMNLVGQKEMLMGAKLVMLMADLTGNLREINLAVSMVDMLVAMTDEKWVPYLAFLTVVVMVVSLAVYLVALWAVLWVVSWAVWLVVEKVARLVELLAVE